MSAYLWMCAVLWWRCVLPEDSKSICVLKSVSFVHSYHQRKHPEGSVGDARRLLECATWRGQKLVNTALLHNTCNVCLHTCFTCCHFDNRGHSLHLRSQQVQGPLHTHLAGSAGGWPWKHRMSRTINALEFKTPPHKLTISWIKMVVVSK